LLLLPIAGPGCIGDPADVPSRWPPNDFELNVEEFCTDAHGMRVARSFLVLADGTAVYRLAPDALVDPQEEFVLPVFRVVSCYRLLPETTVLRILSRKLYTEGFDALEPVQGDQRVTGGTSFKITCRSFDQTKVVAASGMIHGPLVRVMRAINAFLPPGEQFAPAGLTGDREPALLRGVPVPKDDLAGALAFTQSLAALHQEEAALWLDAFALACRKGDRTLALQLLEQWELARGETSREQQLFPEQGLRLSRAQLQRVLPK
jgi:hypothetical protein